MEDTSRIEQVCEILNVEFMKPFGILGEGESYRISSRGIEVFIEKDWHTASPSMLEDLLIGKREVINPKFKPVDGDKYYYITDSESESLDVREVVWEGILEDFERFKLGNCYSSYREAELDKERFIEELNMYYKEFASDEEDV